MINIVGHHPVKIGQCAETAFCNMGPDFYTYMNSNMNCHLKPYLGYFKHLRPPCYNITLKSIFKLLEIY